MIPYITCILSTFRYTCIRFCPYTGSEKQPMYDQ